MIYYFPSDSLPPPTVKKNVEVIFSLQAVYKHRWWAGFGPRGVVCKPALGDGCVGVPTVGKGETMGLAWPHSPVSPEARSSPSAPPYIFLLEDVEYLCDSW